MSFTVISTFSGCGGSSLGYKLAGGDVRLAVEWDDNAVETYRLNFPDTPIYHGDIAKLGADECWKLSGLKPGELDILDGSPPCQGFSTAGKRDFGDDRNQLFREFVRLLKDLQPRVFVMENVSGMVKGKMRLVFVECLRELKAAGYQVRARVLNAMYFSVPQSRERLIFIGVRSDLEVGPSYPKGNGRPVTVRQALTGIEQLYGQSPKAGTKLEECCIGMKPGQNGQQFYGRLWGFNLYRLQWDKPSPVFTKRGGCCGLIHPDLPRKCIAKEYQAIMSFPQSFRLSGTEEDARARLADSVPPNFMRAIAEHIRDTILMLQEVPRG